MHKILLAIDNEEIFCEVIKNKNYDFFNKDIVYKEGIIEVLESNSKIELLIFNSRICGNISIEEFILKIKNIVKNIKIIVYVDKENEDKISFLNSNGIYRIYKLEELNLISINDVIDNIFYENIKINNEINKLKSLMKNYNFPQIKDSKIIVFLGENNVGKTMFSTTVAQIVENINKKVLLISFDIKKFDISLLINAERRSENILKVSNMLDILYTNKYNNIFMEDIKNKYEYIIIDTSNNNEFIKYIFLNNVKVFFIIEPSVLGINKANQLLEKFYNEYNLNVEEIEIIFNRFDKNSISKIILEELFKEYKIIGFCKNGKIRKFIRRKILNERRKKWVMK